VAKRGRL